METKEAVLLNQKRVGIIPLPKDTVETNKDTVTQKEKFKAKPPTTRGFGGGIPSYMKNMEYPDLYDVPAPVFNIEASPEKYKLKAERVYINNYHFKIDKRNYFISTYIGEPFSKGMDNYVYINNLPKKTSYASYSEITGTYDKHWEQNNIFLPNSILFNLTDYNYTNDNKIIINKLNNSQLGDLLQPFYIAKYETTVKEYKEFTDWVLKSNGYDSLPYKIVKGKKCMYQPFDTSKTNYYLKPEWIINKEKAYKYVFFEPTKKILIALNGNSLCVAPCDTIEIDKSHLPNMSINPFYHPSEYYSNFPVVGVSYYQVLAFLDWKTHFHQQQLDKELVNYEIEYALPNTIQRRLAMYPQHIFDDNNWLTDLKLTQQETNYIDKTINQYSVYKHDYATSTLTQVKTDYRSYPFLKEYTLKNGIEWLDGNVSEWMSDTYKENWLPIYNLHKKQLLKTEEGKLASSVEEYYNNKNDKNGQLVIGGNYFDYRNGMVSTQVAYERYPKNVRKLNKAGVYLKKFVDPHKQYSTVGFRYIIKVKDVDEKRKTELLQLIGNYDNNMYQDFSEKFMDMFKKFDNDKYILDREVTNSMWRSFLLDLLKNGKKEIALKCIPKSELWSKYNEDYIFYFKEQKYDELPVVNISHEAAQIFNKWLTEKFNNYALRKFALVELKLPTENEWEIAARGGLRDTSFPWGGHYATNYRGFKLANFKLSPYNTKWYLSDEKGLTQQQQDSVLAIPIEKRKQDFYNSFADSVRIPHLEKYLEGKISYKKFRELDDKYWSKITKVDATTKNASLFSGSDSKKYKQNTTEFYNGHIWLTIKKWYTPNEFGIYNMCGNVAEMINTPTKTKGGSWNSYDIFSRIDSSEQWSGKPSPMVGFRPVMIVKSNINYEKIKGLKSKTPPGTVLINKNYGVDMFEITNVDYREFLYSMKNVYGITDKEYLELLPDTNCWIDSNLFPLPSAMEPFQELYLRHPAFNYYPVVGVSYEQAVKYCEWRSKVITENYTIYHTKHPGSTTIPRKVTYRLPSPDEWEAFVKQKEYYVKSNEKLTETDNKSAKPDNVSSLGPTLVKGLSKNRIGVYGFDTNVSEMTSEKGISKGGNWYQKSVNKHEKLTYTKPQSWLGFRCVVDVEY